MEVGWLSALPAALPAHSFALVESLAMKGLFLACTDHKPQGYELIQRAITKDEGSHIVWHVYALVLRADKNFEEALKCYRKATTIEPVLDSLAPIRCQAIN